MTRRILSATRDRYFRRPHYGIFLVDDGDPLAGPLHSATNSRNYRRIGRWTTQFPRSEKPASNHFKRTWRMPTGRCCRYRPLLEHLVNPSLHKTLELDTRCQVVMRYLTLAFAIHRELCDDLRLPTCRGGNRREMSAILYGYFSSALCGRLDLDHVSRTSTCYAGRLGYALNGAEGDFPKRDESAAPVSGTLRGQATGGYGHRKPGVIQ